MQSLRYRLNVRGFELHNGECRYSIQTSRRVNGPMKQILINIFLHYIPTDSLFLLANYNKILIDLQIKLRSIHLKYTYFIDRFLSNTQNVMK